MVNLGYKRADAKQAVEQALTADATLANNLSGLIRAALAKPSPVKATSVASPTPSPTAVVTTGEKDDEQLCAVVHRMDSLSITLKQIVDKKARWSKRAKYAEVVSLGKKIAGLVESL
jgi:hypothetical protein